MRRFCLVAAGCFVLSYITSASAAPIVHNVVNGGFDSATGNLANNWNNNGGSIRGGSQGGFGWNTSYFAGNIYPTNSTFASTVGGPVRQDLTGLNSTFEAGRAYTLSASLFSSSNYGPSNTSAIAWTLGLTADGALVASDSWYSDEVAAAPADHKLSVTASSTGLTNVSMVYIATAADAGKTIGIRLGGSNPQGIGGSDYYGMMDNIALLSVETPEPAAWMIAAVMLAGAGAFIFLRRRPNA